MQRISIMTVSTSGIWQRHGVCVVLVEGYDYLYVARSTYYCELIHGNKAFLIMYSNKHLDVSLMSRVCFFAFFVM